MNKLTNILQRKTEIQQLIGSDNMDKAMRKMMDFVRDFSGDRDHIKEIIQLNIKYGALESKKSKNADFEQERNAFVYNVLEYLDKIEEIVCVTPNQN